MIEDEKDLETYNKAIKEYKKDNKTYTHGEVLKELGISKEDLIDVESFEIEQDK